MLGIAYLFLFFLCSIEIPQIENVLKSLIIQGRLENNIAIIQKSLNGRIL
jgi:hypothetical protein